MNKYRHYLIRRFVVLFILLISVATLAEQPNTNRWETAIQAFEMQDKENPPKPGAVLFVGSSSIRLWNTLATDFPDIDVLNRGFGGSEISDLVYYAKRIIIRYQPRLMVVYSGDNDIAGGKNPQTVLQDFRALVEAVHDTLPDTRIALIAIKPSIARWDKVEQMKKANELLQDFIEKNPMLEYIDIFTPMIGKDGKPRAELFIDDGLHLNAEGYKLWVEKVRPWMKSNR